MKHQLSNITWREVNWQRPYKLETVWETFSHLAALVPRGAIVWEIRGRHGQVTHLLGADQMYIRKIEGVFRAHGDVQFREVAGGVRQPAALARTLKISHPSLSLNTDIVASMIRAGLRQQKAQVLQPGVLQPQPLWGGTTVIDKVPFEREKQYGAAAAIAKQLLRRKLITPEEYQKITMALTEKYRSAVSSSPQSTRKTGEERSVKCQKSSKS